MRKIAHKENKKIVNISLHDKCPKGKSFMDVTDCAANIGDEILDGKIVSQFAVKDLDYAKLLCSQQINRDLDAITHEVHAGFKGTSLSELHAIYSMMGNAQIITLRNDESQSVQMHRDQFLAVLQELFQNQQVANVNFLHQQSKIDNAKSITELQQSFPEVLTNIHPKAELICTK